MPISQAEDYIENLKYRFKEPMLFLLVELRKKDFLC